MTDTWSPNIMEKSCSIFKQRHNVHTQLTKMHFALEGVSFQIIYNKNNNILYIFLSVRLYQENEGRHPTLKLLHPGHEPASICSQRWLSSSL